MRNRSLAFCLVKSALLVLISTAQGNLMVSNLDHEPTRSAAIASDAWIAQRFSISATDPNTYVLDHVQLRLDAASGDPNDFSVSIYGAVSGIPQYLLGDLVGPDDPSATGIYTYSASGITVSSGSDYYAVVRAATPSAQGSYNWSGVNTTTQNGTWVIGSRNWGSSDGLNWTALGREAIFQIAIYAAIVPEPASLCLIGLGVGFLILLHRRASC